MKIINETWRTRSNPDLAWLDFISTWFSERLNPCEHPLRFYISRVADGWVEMEVTLVKFTPSSPFADTLRGIEILSPRKKSRRSSRFVVAQIVPTGIRCEFGGYAGDAAPATNLLASIADTVVTHPNAVNASDINEMAGNVLYVEGRSLDDFMLGHIGLREVYSNRIGTFVDPSGGNLADDVVNVLNTARAAAGIDCSNAILLDRDLDIQIEWTDSGCASGVIGRPDAIIRGVQSLIARGAQAVGGISVIHGVTEEMFQSHLEGVIPNPSGAVEAVITHLISKLFRLPAAHAPLPYYQKVRTLAAANPRASAEFISTPHYFSVLKGLHRAPEIASVDNLGSHQSELITLNDIAAVVAPADALGGIPSLAADYNQIPLIAVRANHTILDVTAARLGITDVIEVDSYLEAAGVLAALKQGIALDSVRRPISGARIETVPAVQHPHCSSEDQTRSGRPSEGRSTEVESPPPLEPTNGPAA